MLLPRSPATDLPADLGPYPTSLPAALVFSADEDDYEISISALNMARGGAQWAE